MKKMTKLAIKKVTLRDLDQQSLDNIAGGITGDTCFKSACDGGTCIVRTCATCGGQASCLVAC
jgi:hypothetical protein